MPIRFSSSEVPNIINSSGVATATDPAKIHVASDWATPTTTTPLRGFLGLCGYYRTFVKNFGPISRPLHDMLKKDSSKQSHPQDGAFQ